MRLTYNLPGFLSRLSLSDLETSIIISEARGVATEGQPVSECPYIHPYPNGEEQVAKERRLLWRVAHRLEEQRLAEMAATARASLYCSALPASLPIAVPASPACSSPRLSPGTASSSSRHAA